MLERNWFSGVGSEIYGDVCHLPPILLCRISLLIRKKPFCELNTLSFEVPMYACAKAESTDLEDVTIFFISTFTRNFVLFMFFFFVYVQRHFQKPERDLYEMYIKLIRK